MRQSIAALVLLVACAPEDMSRSTRRPADSPSRSSAVQASVKDYQLQRECASDAKAFFDYFETDMRMKSNDEYSNHFNARLGKCFVLITHGITGVNDIYSKTLFDAVERKEYGHYWWQSKPGKKYWEVPPLQCTKQEAQCQSQEEFDTWLKSFMEE
jgi:hypothetical protein